jgi:hypothetical protein
MGLDWYVFNFLKGADDYYLEAFGLETGLKPGSRWYNSIDAPTFLLMSTLKSVDEYWTLTCERCLQKPTVQLLKDLSSDQLSDLSKMSKNTFDKTKT